jgi:capsular exopolysaccharide synthesis family protein
MSEGKKMSGIHRAMEKAERDGLLTWTRADEGQDGRSAGDPARAARSESAVTLVDPPATWEPPAAPVPEDDFADAEGFADPGLYDTPLSPLFVVATEPGSLAAEQYRLLRTRLEGRENAGRIQLLVITSPRLGEGKTTTSANLALTMSQEFQHRVLLVEADLRRPTLAALFGIAPGPGLIDVLLGAATLDDVVVQVPGHQLFLLQAGEGAGRSTELLASSAMQRVVDALRTRFDRIVLDTPPMTLADTHVLGRIADGVLMVVRAGVTSRPAVERALGALDRRKLVGIVLNEVENKPEDAYDYRAYERESGE